MKLLIEKIPDLQALYIKQLRLLLSAEELIAIKSLFLTEVATDDELKHIFNRQWQESEAHAARVRDMLYRASNETGPIKCRAIYALFDEAEDMAQDAAHDSVRNTGLIAVARRIKHYELAVYDALRQFARVLENDDDARILDEILHEENETDQQLANLAERINPTARKVA